MSGYFGGYAMIALTLAVGVLFVAAAFGANRLLRPSRPTEQKLSSYECGLDGAGTGWAQTHIRYYVFAFLYVVFAVEAVFLFPWATVFARPGFGVQALVEMLVFVAFLAVGLLYAWRRKVLEWT